MPIYEYQHTGEGCPEKGKNFEIFQGIREEALKTCPACGKPVQRLIYLTNVNTPMGDSDYKQKGFAKLVRRDTGVYENVTALDHESRFFEADKPETMPDLDSRISD